MIEMLYEPFKRWSEKGSVYLYSDTHFQDEDCKLMDKNWIDPDKQVKIINDIVHKNDTLILLGDIGNVDFISKLKAGHKVLIMGNHDKGITNYKRVIENKHYNIVSKDCDIKKFRIALENEFPNTKINIEKTSCEEYCDAMILDGYDVTIDNNLFDEIYEGALFIAPKICLSHEPINLGFGLNIHGHTHDVMGGDYDDEHFNVCSNTIDYKPINLTNIIKKGILSNTKDIHRLTINKAIERKAFRNEN